MQEELISRFTKVLEDSKIKNIRFSATYSEVYITPSLINFKILVDIFVTFIAAYGTYSVQDKEFYLIPIIFLNSILFIAICTDFNPINKIKIDFVSKTIQIQNRNIFNRLFLRYILTKKQVYDFDEIKSLVVRSNESFRAGLLRYFIDLKIKDGSSRILISFQKENQANNIARFLTSLLKQ